MTRDWQTLRDTVTRYKRLKRANAVLAWDQQTYMPPGGLDSRADTTAYLERLAHETITSKRLGDVLSRLEKTVETMPEHDDEASIVRLTRRVYDQAVKLPTELVSRLAETTTRGQAAWQKARENDDVGDFLPLLKQIVDLQREKADALGYDDDPYDALLNLYEPDMKTKDVTTLFDRLKADLLPFAGDIASRVQSLNDDILRQHYPAEQQLALTLDVVQAIGFNLEHGRQDVSAHPFTIGIDPMDVRITTRVDTNNIASALYASIHEAGHGLYEQGLPHELNDTFLGDAVSLGVHESQSRLWENVVGRSRAFWKYAFPRMKNMFPNQLASATTETMYQAVNVVQRPSPIRVEADEINYNFHIFLRFELERAMIQGELRVRDVQSAWDEKSRLYLGYTPQSDSEGILQDIHWSAGLFGYFPTYTLGTVLAVQLFNQAVTDHPDISRQIAQGQFETLHHWMKKSVYRHGSRYTPGQLVEKATGRPLSPDPYVTYIKNKYKDLYAM